MTTEEAITHLFAPAPLSSLGLGLAGGRASSISCGGRLYGHRFGVVSQKGQSEYDRRQEEDH